MNCRFCGGQALPHGNTCGDSYCQEAAFYQQLARNARKGSRRKAELEAVAADKAAKADEMGRRRGKVRLAGQAELHTPRHRYDCERCKFSWNCGPLCQCLLILKGPPAERRDEVARLREEAGYEP